MPGARLSSDERLSLIVETQREIAAARDDLQQVMQLIAERSQAITGADGAMVHLVDGDMLSTRARTGIATRPLDERRPIATSIARFAIQSGRPVLVENARGDPRVNQASRAKIGHESIICVPLLRGAEVVGTLNVMSGPGSPRLTEVDREVLEMLSVVLSAAVSRASEVEARHAEAVALARFQTLFDGASIGILRVDRAARIVEVNPALAEMLGRSPAQLAGGRFTDHLLPEHRLTVYGRLREMMSGGRESFELEARSRAAGGGLMWWHLRAVLERDEHGTPDCVIAMVEDVSERKRAEQELVRQAELNEHHAMHDPLTGLPNRVLFTDRIGAAIRRARRDGSQLAVALMDLDRFKEVNDTLGHPAGDQLLVEVSACVSGALRDCDTFARLGGDEFGMLLTGLSQIDDAWPILDRVQAALKLPILVHSVPLDVEASIGIAMFPRNGADAEFLIQRADVAMYDAKRESATVRVYDQRSHAHDVNRLTLVGELRRAIEQDELVLHYQPQAAMEGGAVRSVEALVRWQHPSRGLILPDHFIPAAQQTSLIGPLTLHILDLALRQGRAWRDAGAELAISVNLSMGNLLDREFPGQVRERLARWGMAPDSLALEVTESAMLANPKRARVVLDELSQLGIRLSIDDFGTGYSSLCSLRELPVDEMKIDRSFVIGMHEQPGDVAIVRSAIDLGRNLGLDVVAEGVQTRETWETLRALGCQTAQGYYLCRPVPASQLTEWLAAHRRRGRPPASDGPRAHLHAAQADAGKSAASDDHLLVP